MILRSNTIRRYNHVDEFHIECQMTGLRVACGAGGTKGALATTAVEVVGKLVLLTLLSPASTLRIDFENDNDDDDDDDDVNGEDKKSALIVSSPEYLTCCIEFNKS